MTLFSFAAYYRWLWFCLGFWSLLGCLWEGSR